LDTACDIITISSHTSGDSVSATAITLAGSFTETPASGKVVCTMHAAEGQLRIQTTNAGDAIAADLMDHLFEPFVSGNEEGHGLGLWVTYQIVTQLGGQITGESQDGLTQFRVVLPLGENHAY